MQIGDQGSAEIRDRQMVPGWLQVLLYAFIFVGAISSLPMIGQFSPLPVTELLDAWLILLLLAMLLRGRLQHNLLFLILVGFLLTRIVGAIVVHPPLQDFLQAYRWVLYLIVFVVASGKTWRGAAGLLRLTWGLLILATIKSSITLYVLGRGQRPGLLLENNFELALFSGLVMVTFRWLGRGRWLAVALLGVLTVLDESRSGAVAFVLVAVYAGSQEKKASLFVRYLISLLIPAFGLVALLIFQARLQASSSIDRLNFLRVFLENTADWTPVQWIFGTAPITPLDQVSCAQLSYYQSLFSSRGDGSCYSVILHAFNLRVVYDAGLLGLSLTLIVAWFALRRSGNDLALSLALIAIAFTNGLSVSGLNNPYVALPILLAILTAKNRVGLARSEDSSGSEISGLSTERTSARRVIDHRRALN